MNRRPSSALEFGDLPRGGASVTFFGSPYVYVYFFKKYILRGADISMVGWRSISRILVLVVLVFSLLYDCLLLLSSYILMLRLPMQTLQFNYNSYLL